MVTGKENSNLLYGENIYKSISSTEPSSNEGLFNLHSVCKFIKYTPLFRLWIRLKTQRHLDTEKQWAALPFPLTQPLK